MPAPGSARCASAEEEEGARRDGVWSAPVSTRAGAACASGAAADAPLRGHIEVTEGAAGGVWLRVYGDACDTLDSVSRLADAVGVRFSYVAFDKLVPVALPRLGRLRRLREVHLDETEIHSLQQLHALSCLSHITHLGIAERGNPVVRHPHFTSLVLSTLPSLKMLCGEEVTAAQREEAETQWRRLRRLYTLAARGLAAARAPPPFQCVMTHANGGGVGGGGSAKKAHQPPPPQPPPSFVGSYIGRVVEHALGVERKIAAINTAWPAVVAGYEKRVREELDDRQVALRRYEAAARGEGWLEGW